MSRDHDLVLWGATGFCGALVAEYLARHYGFDRSLRWTIAGRDRGKLDALRRRLSAIDGAAAELEPLVADARDRGSLAALARRTAVVASTVGPFARYGTPLVEACVDAQTHYCDITGETQWIRRTIDAFHRRARDGRTRIVHCCGFDSIPSDLGVWMLHREVERSHPGRRLSAVRMFVRRLRGRPSGGTVASLLGLLEETRTDRAVRRVVGDPYGLDPEGSPRGPDRSDQRDVRWSEAIASWTAPFFMAGINTRVVRRTNALLDYPYGRQFRYSEASATGRGLRGWWRAQSLRLGLGGLVIGSSFAPTRALLARWLPSPGEGPDERQRRSGEFEFAFYGTVDGGREHSLQLRGIVRGEGDPGYHETARMLGESAVCLAQDRDDLPDHFGVLTPAVSMGDRLLERLRAAGMTFAVEGPSERAQERAAR